MLIIIYVGKYSRTLWAQSTTATLLLGSRSRLLTMIETLKSVVGDVGMERIKIYCDGACRWNNTVNSADRVGAYAYKLIYKIMLSSAVKQNGSPLITLWS